MADTPQLKVGMHAPVFVLQGTSGRVSVGDLIGTHNLLIYFIREFGCHTCMANALQLAKIKDEIAVTNTRIIMVGGGHMAAAQKTRDRYKLPFPVFADPDRSVYRSFGLDKALLLFQKSGTFLIDKTGIVRYIHAGSNPAAGFDAKQILSEVAKLGTRENTPQNP